MMNRSTVTTVVVALLAVSAAGRTWTRTNGKTVEGEYVQAAAGQVSIKQDNGSTVRIPLNQLSREDQDFVKTQKEEAVKAQKEEAKEAAGGKAATPGPKVKGKSGAPSKDGWLTWEGGKVYDKATTGPEAAGYHLYIPSTFNASNPPPILYLLHAGGDGRGMMNVFKASAEKVGWTLVGCDKVRNKMTDEAGAAIIREIIDEVEKTVPYNGQRIYLGGFSGGASRAYSATYTFPEPFAGVIACGGWIGGQDLYNSHFRRYMAVAMINGSDDGGAAGWTAGDSQALERRKCRVKTFSFKGGHQLPPPETLNEVMKWMEEDWKTRGSKHTQDWGPP